MPPIYEYLCPKCERIYEHIHKHDEILRISCDDCLIETNKIISVGSFRLYGSPEGWGPATKPNSTFD